VGTCSYRPDRSDSKMGSSPAIQLRIRMCMIFSCLMILVFHYVSFSLCCIEWIKKCPSLYIAFLCELRVSVVDIRGRISNPWVTEENRRGAERTEDETNGDDVCSEEKYAFFFACKSSR
jgi:hypothetical protein